MKKTMKAVGCTVALALSTTMLQAQSLEDGLEVYLNFDEGMGDVANDSSGNDREMVPAQDIFPGAVIDWSGGKFGGSVKFDSNYMLHSPFEYYGIGGAEPRTVSFWIKTEWQAANSSSVGALVGWGINAARQRIHVKMNGSTDADGNVLQHIRTENQGGNNFGNSLPINDGVWHHIISVFDPEVDANDDGILAAVGDFDHFVDNQLETKGGGVGNPVETNINPEEGAVPLTLGGGYFPNINAARVSEARIDEFRLYSRALSAAEIEMLFNGEGVDGPPAVEITNDLEGAELVDVETPIEFEVRAQSGATLAASDVTLMLNGVDHSGDLQISGSGAMLTGSYSGLRENVVYHGRIGATDSEGRTYSFDFSFDTISEDNFTIEAEDFNFEGGSFFDDPTLCRTPGSEADCYFDRVSEQGVDANDSFDDDRPSDSDADFETFTGNAYRFGPGGFRDELVDTWISGDRLRGKFADTGDPEIVDFDVERVATDEWMNYTRTFETGTYQVLLRARSRAEQSLELGVVNGGDANALGTFDTGVTGSSYGFTYLRDESGNIATVELDGEQTLRLTATNADGNVDLNYLMFVPFDPSAVVTPPVPPVPSVPGAITSVNVNGDGSVTIEFTGVLSAAGTVDGPYVPVAEASSPFTVTPGTGEDAQFYIAR
jgi:hypothetical protein